MPAAATFRPEPAAAEPLLAVRDLRLGFGDVAVLRDVAFDIRRGEILALVGESGCGKSLTALAILGLLPPGARIAGGEIRLADAGDLLAMRERERRGLRGRRIGMIFQEPMSALNPVLTIGYQIGESLRLHRGLSRRAARDEARRLLELVAMPDPEQRLASYPHQMSGGQLQRAMIAMVLAGEPDLLLADEPTTALDVTVQAQVLDLLLDLRRRLGLTVLLITHDLAVVAECSDRVVVMYAGQVVEVAAVEALFRRPAHPYTEALLAALPRRGGAGGLPAGIPGQVPEPGHLPPGCSFHPRCPAVFDDCRRLSPALYPVAAGEPTPHVSRCLLHAEPP